MSWHLRPQAIFWAFGVLGQMHELHLHIYSIWLSDPLSTEKKSHSFPHGLLIAGAFLHSGTGRIRSLISIVAVIERGKIHITQQFPV